MALLSGVYLGLAGWGTWVALSRDLSGRPFGIATDLSVIQSFVFGLGTALSAPLALLLLLAALNAWLLRSDDRRPIQLITILAGGFLVGMLVEPILDEVLVGRHDLPVTILVAGNVLVPGRCSFVASQPLLGLLHDESRMEMACLSPASRDPGCADSQHHHASF